MDSCSISAKVQPYHPDCFADEICKKRTTSFVLTSHKHSLSLERIIKMSSVKKNTPLTAEEHQKMHTLIAMQMEALGPGPHKSLSTTCFKGKAAYVDGATLRLQALEYLIEQGILTSEEAEKVKVSRCKCANLHG